MWPYESERVQYVLKAFADKKEEGGVHYAFTKRNYSPIKIALSHAMSHCILFDKIGGK